MTFAEKAALERLTNELADLARRVTDLENAATLPDITKPMLLKSARSGNARG